MRRRFFSDSRRARLNFRVKSPHNQLIRFDCRLSCGNLFVGVVRAFFVAPTGIHPLQEPELCTTCEGHCVRFFDLNSTTVLFHPRTSTPLAVLAWHRLQLSAIRSGEGARLCNRRKERQKASPCIDCYSNRIQAPVGVAVITLRKRGKKFSADLNCDGKRVRGPLKTRSGDVALVHRLELAIAEGHDSPC